MVPRFLEITYTRAHHLAAQRVCFLLSYLRGTALMFLNQFFIRQMKLISKNSFKTQPGLFILYTA